MTAGELLVSLSGLASGTALQHLQAITTGSGTGTRLVSQMTIHLDSPQMTLTRIDQTTVEQVTINRLDARSSKKRLDVLLTPSSMTLTQTKTATSGKIGTKNQVVATRDRTTGTIH